jgi:hypothetical protein
VVFVQDRPVLGGNSSSEIRVGVAGADGGGVKKTDVRESGIIEELRLERAVGSPNWSVSMWDLLLYDKIRSEPNITLLLNTACTEVTRKSEDRIEEVLALCQGSEDVVRIRGSVFIDCSGDGELGFLSGADFRMGREGRAEFKESYAPPEPDDHLLGSSILFSTREYDRPMPFIAPSWARKFPTCEDLPNRRHEPWTFGFWWIEYGGQLNTIHDNERIRDELMAVAMGVWDHIKNSGKHPSSANWALEWVGFVPGKRESRRLMGDYILKQRDVESGETFHDGVAYGGWPIDLHPPEGIVTPGPPSERVRVPLYNIPFRCLYSRNVGNLLFAGRNISASHVALGSTRVMATCAVMGQAVGTAAALCVRRKIVPRELGRNSITDLQQQLLKDDAYIIGVSNNDPCDLARKAAVRASSQMPDGRAASVINGVHRRVFDKGNCWSSARNKEMPQWIDLHFPETRRLREVHLVFDTDLCERSVTKRRSGGNRVKVGGPRPLTVRDYELQLLDGDSARTVVRVEGNYQRKRVHCIEPAFCSGLRLLVHATKGDCSARVFEIRAYS